MSSVPDMASFPVKNPAHPNVDRAEWSAERYAELLSYAETQLAEAAEQRDRLQDELKTCQTRRESLLAEFQRYYFDAKQCDVLLARWLVNLPKLEILPTLIKRQSERWSKLDQKTRALRGYVGHWQRVDAHEADQAARRAAEDAAKLAREEHERSLPDRVAQREISEFAKAEEARRAAEKEAKRQEAAKTEAERQKAAREWVKE